VIVQLHGSRPVKIGYLPEMEEVGWVEAEDEGESDEH